MQTISLQDYTIYTGSCLEQLPGILDAMLCSKLFVLVDENTHSSCWPLLADMLDRFSPKIISIQAGERHKNLETCVQIWAQLMEERADRRSVMLNLGGGVIGDMGGFCAATFKRGFAFIQIPTTLLAQVDASIGGKLGIDFAEVKNSIGLFANPHAVIADPLFFQTLPSRELRSGFAEIIKHALIADTKQWDNIRSIASLSEVDWSSLVVPSLQIKQQIVTRDPFEHGLRKALNFGHTIGHAIESFFLPSDKPLLHGEAIAAGMICETYLSHRHLSLSEAEMADIVQVIKRLYQPRAISESVFPSLIGLMQHDKKNAGQEINFSLLPTAGKVEVNQTCTPEWILRSLHFFNSIANS